MNSVYRWYEIHENIVTLTSWMADNGCEATEIAYAVEKPWKYEEEFKTAKRELSDAQG